LRILEYGSVVSNMRSGYKKRSGYKMMRDETRLKDKINGVKMIRDLKRLEDKRSG